MKLKTKSQQILKSNKLYLTDRRQEILKVLLHSDNPMSQEQIAKHLFVKKLDKATIYRTLETFCEKGIVHLAYVRQRTCYYELAENCTESQCHPHFTCNDCGQTHCLTDMLPAMPKSPHKGFVIKHQQIQLDGLCPQCSNKPA